MRKSKLYIIVVIFALLGLWYCFFASRNDNIKEIRLLHTVVPKQYPEVFFWESSWEIQQYNLFKQQWVSCVIIEDTTIGDGRKCGPISGYQHIYSIPEWHLLITWYENTYPDIGANPGIFTANDPHPFVLSGNGIYQIDENGYSTSIQYFNFKSWETAAIILSGQWTTNVSMIASSWSRSEYTFINPSITIDEWITYMYYFDSSKSYYYLVRAASMCSYAVCWLDQHRIWFFND
jgi:hypothetical protein